MIENLIQWQTHNVLQYSIKTQRSSKTRTSVLRNGKHLKPRANNSNALWRNFSFFHSFSPSSLCLASQAGRTVYVLRIWGLLYEIQSPVEKEQLCLFGHLLTPSEDKSGQRERDTGKGKKRGKRKFWTTRTASEGVESSHNQHFRVKKRQRRQKRTKN